LFIGNVEFEGEQGYTAAHAKQASGKITRTLKETCTNNGSEEGQRSALGWTLLRATSADGEVAFNAFKIESKFHPALDRTAFSASVAARPGGMSIFRTIQSRADTGSSKITKSHGRVATAGVSPLAPFSGSASYQRAPNIPQNSGPVRWRGTSRGWAR
jgi:hypothetical protein